ncbi:putative baseplate assembly protein [Frateuria edaphi]|uniref:putative baseplate assembly protein n=1 Tax=Frateuria edaphi TaxID=2898793 RepID=UPI001E5C633B|nr:putative baseplate assembly protein [Frateuria edaphi]UGB47221.1 putative baseplate assembly protein [Frateuria edaphi]
MSCCSACGSHACACGCGAGTRTPRSLYNRPGLASLAYRVGSWADFHATMQMDLSDGARPALARLRTREPDDPALALLDAWAIGADVLSFYQERIANEGYLRTATERRSVLELGRLVDYRLRPGVAASVYLAYTIEKDSPPVTIPAGARAQSIPAPGEQMQTFETAEPLESRYEWNAMCPRLTRPQEISLETVADLSELWIATLASQLKPNDLLLFLFGDLPAGVPAIRRVQSLEVEQASARSRVLLQPLDKLAHAVVAAAHVAVATIESVAYEGDVATQATALRDELVAYRNQALLGLPESWYTAHKREGPLSVAHLDPALQPVGMRFWDDLAHAQGDDAPAPSRGGGSFRSLIEALARQPAPQPASSLHLHRSIAGALGPSSDARPQLLVNLRTHLADSFYRAWTSVPRGMPSPALTGVHALRLAAPLFGYNAPRIMGLGLNTDDATRDSVPYISRPDGDWAAHEQSGHVQLDNAYDGVLADSYLVIQSAGEVPLVAKARSVQIHPRSDYGISGKTTDIALYPAAGDEDSWPAPSMTAVRSVQVHAQSEPLRLAEQVIDEPVGKVGADEAGPRSSADTATRLTLDTAVDGLKPGRWILVEGQRTDVPGTDAVRAAEAVMLTAVEQGVDTRLPGDTVHSTLVFANQGLAYRYRRDSVLVYANVVRATHGETRNEVLGSGNGAAAMQAFALKQPPLTYVSAPTVDGVQSTLVVRVNALQWHEIDNLAFADARARSFVTATDDEGKTRVLFGDGIHGARLPTGIENIVASYRNGIGLPGNVQARQISLLGTRPLGVKEVINPLHASGGADAETRDQARGNVPLAVRALDRLVSVPDYADFARMFGGVGKAVANRLGAHVLVTIAGAADAPVETTSDLYRNLLQALQRYGDPSLPVSLAVRERLALTMSARVGLVEDYAWVDVEPRLRGALLDRFGFERRALAQDAYLSEVVGCLQAIPGVAWIDVDAFDSLSAAALEAAFEQDEDKSAPDAPRLMQRIQALPARYGADGLALPAQLACFLPAVPDTLLLQEATP